MNMDIKELFAKLKSKGGNGRRTNGGISSFFAKNPKMKIIIPVIFIVISFLVALVIIIQTGSTKIPDVPASSGEPSSDVEVLPQDIRDAEKLDGINDAQVFNEAVLAHPKVTAIFYNNDGYYVATVETDNAHYPNLKVGDYVAGSDWLVESITETQVVFTCNEQKITVNF